MSESQKHRTYLAIDLKSFFASVECVERGLNPLSTNLVVADASRTEKTICLAVTPSLKAYGIAGRARLFEVQQQVRRVNALRRQKTYAHRLTGKSWCDEELQIHPDWEVDFLIAPPRMQKYVDYSVRVYGVYLRYIAPEDIHIYSIDEVFIDATPYLSTYHLTAHEFTVKLIREVLAETGITATAGIGTNLFLAKVAMDVVAKHLPADADGVRIAHLDEMSYREQLWSYRPITKIWRVGRGIAERLAQHGMYTMGDVARQSLRDEELLYHLFGKRAELLIDYAWGWEPCTLSDIRAYRPQSQSLSRGQVLHSAYSFEKALVVMKEMIEEMALTLVDKHLVTDQIILNVGYDHESLALSNFWGIYHGPIVCDHYGRSIPKPLRLQVNLPSPTSSAQLLREALLPQILSKVNRYLLVRTLNVIAGRVRHEEQAAKEQRGRVVQLDLFTDYEELKKQKLEEKKRLEKERALQETVLRIKKTFGKNAILKGLNFEEGATARDRNGQIGGHKA